MPRLGPDYQKETADFTDLCEIAGLLFDKI